MFTGIVEGKASVRSVQQLDGLSRLHIDFRKDQGETRRGASVALDGACLTVTAIDGNNLVFDVMQETLRVTTLGSLKTGSEINFEHAARIGDEIGGHLLSGHIHATVVVARVIHHPNNVNIAFTVPEALRKYVLHKGYIGVNGASLTIGHITADGFSVDLIPETLAVTTFGAIAENWQDGGESFLVNLEIDSQTQAIVDTVERVLQQRQA